MSMLQELQNTANERVRSALTSKRLWKPSHCPGVADLTLRSDEQARGVERSTRPGLDGIGHLRSQQSLATDPGNPVVVRPTHQIRRRGLQRALTDGLPLLVVIGAQRPGVGRSEEHTSELQSHVNLVCRL